MYRCNPHHLRWIACASLPVFLLICGCLTIAKELGKEGIIKIDAKKQHKRFEQRSRELKNMRELCDLSMFPRQHALAQKSIAVVDFELSGNIAADQGSAYADVCRNIVEITDRHVLLSSESTFAILETSELGGSRACPDLICYDRLAKTLNVDLVICGSLAENQGRYTTRLMLADIERQHIFSSEARDVEESLVELSFVNTCCDLLKEQLQP